MLFVCSTHALTLKVGVAVKPLSLQVEDGASWVWSSLPKRIIVSAFVILHFWLTLIAPLHLLCVTHFILNSRCWPLLSMPYWFFFVIPLELFQTCSSQSSPWSAPASLGCQGPAPQATCPRVAKALTRHVLPICSTRGGRARAHSCKPVIPHPWVLRTLRWAFRLSRVRDVECSKGGKRGRSSAWVYCISYSCIMVVSVLAKLACFVCEQLSLYVKRIETPEQTNPDPETSLNV